MPRCLFSKGIDVLAVGRRLGHSRASTTLDRYGHLVEGDRRRCGEGD